MYGDFCTRYEKEQMDICRMICEYAEKAYDMGYEEGTKKVQAQADHNCFWSGFRLGREDDKSCKSCMFEDKAIGEEPCKNCKHSYIDEWEAKR